VERVEDQKGADEGSLELGVGLVRVGAECGEETLGGETRALRRTRGASERFYFFETSCVRPSARSVTAFAVRRSVPGSSSRIVSNAPPSG
jgi:hypothetical protein